MITWLVLQTLLLSLIITCLVFGSKYLNRLMGAQNVYQLWAIIPISLMSSILMALSLEASSHANNEFMVYASQTLATITQQVSLSNHYIISLVWLITAGVMVCWFAFSMYQYTARLDLTNTGLKIQNIEIYESQHVISPQLHGVIKPKIILPMDFYHVLSPEQQTLVLKHESTHWQQGDTYWNVLALAVLSLFWFNPLFWIAYKKFRHQQELSCDSKVLASASLPHRQSYAMAMITVSAHAGTSRFTQLYYGEKTNMKNRISSLIQHKHHARMPALALVIAASTVLTMSQFALAKQDSQEVWPTHQVSPEYPSQAENDALEGWVTLSFSIETDGRVSDIAVIGSEPGDIFDSSAKEAFAQWTYSQPTSKLTEQKVMLSFVLDQAAE